MTLDIAALDLALFAWRMRCDRRYNLSDRAYCEAMARHERVVMHALHGVRA